MWVVAIEECVELDAGCRPEPSSTQTRTKQRPRTLRIYAVSDSRWLVQGATQPGGASRPGTMQGNSPILLNIEDSPQFDAHIAGFERETEWLLGAQRMIHFARNSILEKIFLWVASAAACRPGRSCLMRPSCTLLTKLRFWALSLQTGARHSLRE